MGCDRRIAYAVRHVLAVIPECLYKQMSFFVVMGCANGPVFCSSNDQPNYEHDRILFMGTPHQGGYGVQLC